MHRFSYISNPLKKPYSYVSVIDVLERRTAERPTQEILIHRRENGSRISITNEVLNNISTHLAKYLYNNGIKRGDTVGLYGPNTIEWVIGELAILKTGATSVNISLETITGDDAMSALLKANCKMLIIDPGLDMEMLSSVHILSKCISSFNERISGTRIDLVLLRPTSGFEHAACLDNILLMNMQVKLPEIYPEDPAILFPTSASTGTSKMVSYSHFSLANSSVGRTLYLSSTTHFNDRPFSWIGGASIFNLLYSCTRVFTDTTVSIKGSNSAYIWNIIKQEACTEAFVLPFLLQDLCTFKQKYRDDFLLRVIFTGGQIIDHNCGRAVGLLCNEMNILYGATEGGYTLYSIIRGKDLKIGHCGKPTEGTEIKIIDSHGDTVPKGMQGEVCIRNRASSQGYLNDPLQNKKLYRPGDWLCLEDIGFIDSEDDLVIMGRSKDIISRGTRKLIPSMIEGLFKKMPGLKEVVAIPVPDKRLGEEVCICFTTIVDAITQNDVMKFCEANFLKDVSLDGKGGAPSYYVKLDQLPMLKTGKPDKASLKQLAISKLNIF